MIGDDNLTRLIFDTRRGTVVAVCATHGAGFVHTQTLAGRMLASTEAITHDAITHGTYRSEAQYAEALADDRSTK
jgi:hypothetical protein